MKHTAAAFAALAAVPALAQEAPGAAPFDDEIVVVGERPTGGVIGDIEPVIALDAAQARAYGASTLGELLEALAPFTRSAGGRGSGQPAVLLNGRRISGFRELRQYPPEAIARVEVYPEEVALKYGFRADQRVVNIVLRERFRALTVEGEVEAASDGGRFAGEADANRLRIRNGARFSVDAEFRHETALLESERAAARAPARGDRIGNVYAAIPGGEIDPAFSALSGVVATSAGAPAAAADGPVALSQFAANAPNATDQASFRTLEPRREQASVSAAYSDVLFGDIEATASAALDYEASQSAIGLAGAALALPASSPFSPFAVDAVVEKLFDAPGALMRNQETLSGEAAIVLNGPQSDWTWSATTKLARSRAETLTDRGVDAGAFASAVAAGTQNPFAPPPADALALVQERSLSVRDSASLEATLTGEAFTLPAGAATLTAKAGASATRLASEDAGATARARLDRQAADAQVNLDAPLFGDGAAPLGAMTLSGNARIEELSDFGALAGYGAALNWRPIDRASLVASVSVDEAAPSIQQLGDPATRTPNARVYDFASGQTVETVTRIDGGSPGLAREERRVLRLSMNVEPFAEKRFSINASYADTRVDNAIAAFPSLTPDVEAAFPQRFTRDASGALLEIDARPINYAQTRSREMQYGFVWSKDLKVSPPELSEADRARLRAIMAPRAARAGAPAPGAAPVPESGAAPPAGRPDGPPPGEARGGPPPEAGGRGFAGGPPGGFGRGGGRFFGGRGGMGGRVQVSAQHRIALEDSILVAPGAARLDLLGGDAVSANGGASRHAVDARADYFRRGVGASLVYSWKSGAAIADAGPGGAGDIRFSDLGKIDVRLSLDPTQRPRMLIRYPFLRGSRITLRVDNLFNARQSAVDAGGATPLNYQPALLDPQGRTVRLEFRKLFF